MTAAAIIIAFLAGVLVGLMFREAFEIARGKDDPMAALARIRGASVSWLAIGLIVSMLMTGAVGIRLAISDNARGDLVTCLSDYNTQVGEARDTRTDATVTADKAQSEYLMAEIAYQQGLLEAITSGNDNIDNVLAIVKARIVATRHYVTELARLRNVREEKPYPAPDLCEGK